MSNDAVLRSFKPVPIRQRIQPYYAAVGTLLEAFNAYYFKSEHQPAFKLTNTSCRLFVVLYKDFSKRRVYCLTAFGVGYLTPANVALRVD
jgi:hypothetical protein